jgi:hypothetical protein
VTPEDLERQTEWADVGSPEEPLAIFEPQTETSPNPEENPQLEIRVPLKAVDITADGQEKPSKTNAGVVAQKISNLMQKGVPLNEAAKTMGMDPKMMPRDLVTKLTVAAIQTYQMPSEVDTALVRSFRRKVLLEEGFTETGDRKLALDAAKQIASDPATGLNAPPQPIVQINLTELQTVIDKGAKVDPKELFRDE